MTFKVFEFLRRKQQDKTIFLGKTWISENITHSNHSIKCEIRIIVYDRLELNDVCSRFNTRSSILSLQLALPHSIQVDRFKGDSGHRLGITIFYVCLPSHV